MDMDGNDFRKVLMDFIIRMEHSSARDSDVTQGQDAMRQIADVLHIGCVKAFFYDDEFKESKGVGEILPIYDSGCEYGGEPVTERRVTGNSSIVIYQVWKKINMPEWGEVELERIRVFVAVLYVFNGRSRLMRRNHRLTFYDQDMNIFNLKAFFRKVGELMHKGKLMGYFAMYINLKRFSVINMQVGRDKGNIVMRRYIDMFEEILDPDELICRIGGDNFAVLAKDHKLEQMLKIVAGVPVVFDDITGERLIVSATAGIFRIDGTIPVSAPTDVMDRIGIAATIAKSRTKHDIAFFDDEMLTRHLQSLHIASVFPSALANEEFHVFYQPKISMSDGSLIGAEALCRWKKGGRFCTPAEFIPILERGRDICKLDFYMIDHVCRNLRKWLDMGKKVVKISVNLSRRHLTDVDLLEHILSIVDKYNIPHKYIEIELTETTTDVEFNDLKRIISGLQTAGISTSVDDFGVGYSSLTLIKDIPWNVLKVDKSFLPDESGEYDIKKQIMFKYVVALANEIGLECVAEGVETKEQVELLKANACAVAQGYFFDEPLPVEEFEKRLDGCNYEI